jgi:hypothetical protein
VLLRVGVGAATATATAVLDVIPRVRARDGGLGAAVWSSTTSTAITGAAVGAVDADDLPFLCFGEGFGFAVDAFLAGAGPRFVTSDVCFSTDVLALALLPLAFLTRGCRFFVPAGLAAVDGCCCCCCSTTIAVALSSSPLCGSITCVKDRAAVGVGALVWRWWWLP